MRILFVFLVNFVFFQTIAGQSKENSWQYPVDQGRILYEYSGNTEGYRELFFRNSGAEQALYTNLIRSSTFFAVKTTAPENVVEFLKEGKHYHFDLETKTGLVIDFPIHLLHKYFRIPENKSYVEGLVEIGAQNNGQDEILGKLCEKWSYRGRTFWIWEGLMMKMTSTGLNKNFSMEAVESDFTKPVPDEKFIFPKKIPIEK